MFVSRPITVVARAVRPNLESLSMALRAAPLPRVFDHLLVRVLNHRFAALHHVLVQLSEQLLAFRIAIDERTQALKETINYLRLVRSLAILDFVTRHSLE